MNNKIREHGAGNMTMGSHGTRRLTGRAARGWRALCALALALCMTEVLAINLKLGELKIMNPGDIDRVAVGNANVISTSLLKNGQLLVFGEAPGLTTLHLWLKNGQESQVEFTVDKSEYSAAITSGVDGIVGECGGSCACATCHCYVDEARLGDLPPPSAGELDMLANVAAERRANSRLACQIKASPLLEGLVLTLPDTQE